MAKPTEMNPVADAEAVVSRLAQRREQIVAERSAAVDRTGTFAYDAHVKGDQKALAALDEIATTVARADSALREIDHAAAEANRQVVIARQAEALAADRQRAEEARKLVHETGKCFGYLDRHLTEAARALIAINDGFAQLRQAGFAVNDTQDRLGIAAIIQTWAHQLPRHVHNQLRDGLQFLAPDQRKTAAQHWAGVEPSLQNQIAQHLGEAGSAKQKEEAA